MYKNLSVKYYQDYKKNLVKGKKSFQTRKRKKVTIWS